MSLRKRFQVVYCNNSVSVIYEAIKHLYRDADYT